MDFASVEHRLLRFKHHAGAGNVQLCTLCVCVLGQALSLGPMAVQEELLFFSDLTVNRRTHLLQQPHTMTQRHGFISHTIHGYLGFRPKR